MKVRSEIDARGYSVRRRRGAPARLDEEALHDVDGQSRVGLVARSAVGELFEAGG
jgi:hypothetical protein